MDDLALLAKRGADLTDLQRLATAKDDESLNKKRNRLACQSSANVWRGGSLLDGNTCRNQSCARTLGG